LKLSTLPLSARAKHALEAQKIIVAGDLARLSESKLLKHKNVGRKTVTEFRNLLRSLGLHFGMNVGADPLRPVSVAQLALPIDLRVKEPNDLRGALKAHVDAATSSARNARWTIEHLGWDGKPGRTLEAIGQAENVTRERVRQVAAKCCLLLEQRETTPQALKKTLAIIRKSAPLTQSRLDGLMRGAGLADERFDIRSIHSAAKVFGEPFPFVLEKDDAGVLILPKKLQHLRETVLKIARNEVSSKGYVSHDQLAALCPQTEGNLEFVRRFLVQDESFATLSEGADWWWRPESAAHRRNRVVNTIRKVLAACPKVSLNELRDAVRRPVRARGHAPPRAVLFAICKKLPFVAVEDDWICRKENANWSDILTEYERALVKAFDSSPVLSSTALNDAAARNGLHENYINILKVYSPLLWRPSRTSYALVGADIPVGLVDELERSRPPAVGSILASGWTRDARIYLCHRVTEGLRRSASPSMPAAFKELLQGRFTLLAPDENLTDTVVVRRGTIANFRNLFVLSDADFGDTLFTLFDPQFRTCHAWIGGSELANAALGGDVDALVIHLRTRAKEFENDAVNEECAGE
jgi:hypothetical protein